MVDREADDASIVGWGLAFDDRAVAYLPDTSQIQAGRQVMWSPTPEHVRRRLARRADVRLVWVDNAP